MASVAILGGGASIARMGGAMTAQNMMYYGSAATSHNNVVPDTSCQMINATHCICNVTKITQPTTSLASALNQTVPDSICFIVALILGGALFVGFMALHEGWI